MIKPVVDEFLIKQAGSEAEQPAPEVVEPQAVEPDKTETPTDMEETAKIATPEEITEFINDIAQKKQPKAKRLVVNVASHDKNIKVKNLTNVDVGVARELLIPSTAVHVKNRHPDMDISDWLYLPEFAEKFDAVVESETIGDQKMPRLVFIKNRDGLAYVYVADLATGKRQGDRLSVVTYFKDKPKTLIENLKKNGVKQEDAESVLNALFFNDESLLSQAYSQRSEEGDSSDQLTASEQTIPNPPPDATGNSDIDSEIESLRSETDRKAFGKRLDDLEEMLKERGLMDKYSTKLEELYDILEEITRKSVAAQQSSTADIDSEIAELETLVGKGDIFDDKMDALIEKIDGLGLMEQYEPKLLQLDRDNSNENAKGVK